MIKTGLSYASYERQPQCGERGASVHPKVGATINMVQVNGMLQVKGNMHRPALEAEEEEVENFM